MHGPVTCRCQRGARIASLKIRRDQFCIARVLNEDDDYLLIEVLKKDDTPVVLDENPDANRFYTLLFVKQDDKGGKVWKPWEDDDD